jgi:pimeloyl-ACP methyl ester carboxylesterase
MNENTNTNFYINLGNWQLAYQVFGTGKNVILAFKGYGQSTEVFKNLAPSLGDSYTIFALDLPSHLKIKYLAIKPKQWEELLKTLFQTHHIQEFSTISYSIGAKFGLATFFYFHQNIKKTVWIAPDGFFKKFWYGISTSFLGRILFRHFAKKPFFYIFGIKVLAKVHILPKNLARFVLSQVQTPTQRNTLLETWLVARKLKFSIEIFKKDENENSQNRQDLFFLSEKDIIFKFSFLSKKINQISENQIIKSQKNHQEVFLESLLSDKLKSFFNAG